MNNKKVFSAGPASSTAVAALIPEKSSTVTRSLIGTLLGILVFAAAVLLSDASHMKMPGHIVLLWFPALMAGRALSGYKGSGLLISAIGGGLANAYHPPMGADVLGFVLAALVVEGTLLPARREPSAVVGIFLGLAAALGKMLPKLAVIMVGGATPNHNRMTLPFMFASYVLFGALAGVIYVVGRYLKRKAASRISSAPSHDTSGVAWLGVLFAISTIGILAVLYV
ncbi:MAG: hypothetical protein BWY09_01755 [Candidatus Hydrogenedentes bacterium ADurb.Bin179]|nr:MAG: hypothetical protein BWY09_01755 [Candidatus Hydrogenedentes bacterium ADurb.Bin179]